ncbi:MAG: 2-oxoglutarate dehydrogenase E1 component [Gemmatimonadetes bacterium]|nr:2-oxoglutarate dehydrogenase E1 component [Gemmatimonadota bacterium]
MSDIPFDHQNAAYAQLLYEEFARNPEAVPSEWRAFFDRGPAAAQDAGLIVPDGLADRVSANGVVSAPAAAPLAAADDPGVRAELAHLRALLPLVSRATGFIQAYRDHGHTRADINPLGIEQGAHPQLDPSFFGTSMEELDQVPASVVMEEGREGESVAGALRRLEAAYTGHIGYEFEHMEDPERVRWLWAQVESGVHTQALDGEARKRLLRRLTQVEGFEQFLHRAYLGQKRFSIEGTDMMVPMLDLALEEASARGSHRVVLGMAHRGRLNVLTHILKVPYEDLLREFEGLKGKGALHVAGTGDVKYHHGARGRYETAHGTLEIVLAPNPSHLEYVNPVVMGMARAWQYGSEDSEVRASDRVVPILIHGDAAFAAEGVVAETLNMARLEGYAVGGSIHIIANNQIGFTTTPGEGRSTRYSSDLAKGFDFPILHVNADEPEACLGAIRLAMAYRDHYHDDVVIDLIGYRRHGHNEGDEPAYTQPRLYQRISDHPTARTKWAARLVDEGVATPAEVEAIDEQVLGRLREAQDSVKAESPADVDVETELEPAAASQPATSVALETLQRVNEASVAVPDGFTVHPKLQRQLKRRHEGLEADTRLDWAYGEALAIGSLLVEGLVVRLTGQDAQRGTFSHRHIVLHDAETGELHTPLASLGPGRLEVFNSPLTEAGVVGFEYGYSVASERDLVLWEGQFGDFVNVAQVAIDQFISSGREKWGQVSNLSLLLPHGYEGQGPEHSSARLERFLQLCAEGNMRVVYPTTPAQHFHLLRRQALWRPSRPMIVMTPKSLLRLPAASSTAAELVNAGFRPVLEDPMVEDRASVRRLVLCTGKVYYDIQGHRRRDEAEGVAVARIEELYPFPAADLDEMVRSYPGLSEVVWAQEEPRNMGALTFVGPRLRAVVPREIPLRYVARPERASPAEGKASDHTSEQQRIVLESLGISEE